MFFLKKIMEVEIFIYSIDINLSKKNDINDHFITILDEIRDWYFEIRRLIMILT
jgi:hypothetical protein